MADDEVTNCYIQPLYPFYDPPVTIIPTYTITCTTGKTRKHCPVMDKDCLEEECAWWVYSGTGEPGSCGIVAKKEE
jgi:hypothetical protein